MASRCPPERPVPIKVDQPPTRPWLGPCLAFAPRTHCGGEAARTPAASRRKRHNGAGNTHQSGNRMRMMKRAVALAVAGTLLAACAHKDKDAPLAFVPADTPYVVANLKVPDDATREAMLAQANAQLPTQLQQMRSAADEMAARDPATARLLRAFVSELDGKDLADLRQERRYRPEGPFRLLRPGPGPGHAPGADRSIGLRRLHRPDGNRLRQQAGRGHDRPAELSRARIAADRYRGAAGGGWQAGGAGRAAQRCGPAAAAPGARPGPSAKQPAGRQPAGEAGQGQELQAMAYRRCGPDPCPAAGAGRQRPAGRLHRRGPCQGGVGQDRRAGGQPVEAAGQLPDRRGAHRCAHAEAELWLHPARCQARGRTRRPGTGRRHHQGIQPACRSSCPDWEQNPPRRSTSPWRCRWRSCVHSGRRRPTR